MKTYSKLKVHVPTYREGGGEFRRSRTVTRNHRSVIPVKQYWPAGLINAVIVLGTASLALATTGCGNAQDQKIETGLSDVASHRAAHPHYPVTIQGDFGPDNGPIGVTVDAYGFYAHTVTKPDPRLNVLSVTTASAKIAKLFELSIRAIKDTEAKVPAPKPPYPTSPDWKQIPHPKQGTYTIVSRIGPKPQSFDIDGEPKPGELASDANSVVTAGLKSQQEALMALKVPGGFSVCTAELLSIQQGNRGVEPHLLGDPLLLIPIDKDLAVKAMQHAIEKILATTSKLKPAPSIAHLVITGPGSKDTFPISMSVGPERQAAIQSVLTNLGARFDTLNQIKN